MCGSNGFASTASQLHQPGPLLVELLERARS